MTTKLKIDLSQGVLEVEGSEAFVRTIYSDFKTHFAGIDEEWSGNAKKTRRPRKSKTTSSKITPAAQKSTAPAATAKKVASPQTAKKTDASPAPPKPPTYSYIDDLPLEATDSHPSLVEFMDTKFPITNEERNIVFIYFLRHLLKLDKVTPDHIYTCYRAVKFRAPLNIENTLTRRDWIEVDKDHNLTLTEAGKRYVENQLPKKVKN